VVGPVNARVAGRYQLVREIGAGGMGRVFQALDMETGTTVAAKMLMAGDEVSLDALIRFQTEGAVLSALKHPNIVQVYSTHLEDHISCIIMEFLEGRSLGQILRAERLSLARTKHLMQQVATALAFAHSRGVVHRDVKPDNIMIVGNDHVKVTDFGIARVLQEGNTLRALTVTGASMGTPLYMAPEQIEGQRVDGRTDIYAVQNVAHIVEHARRHLGHTGTPGEFHERSLRVRQFRVRPLFGIHLFLQGLRTLID